MKKIITFLLFLSLHGYASTKDDSKPSNSKVSASSALPLITPQLSTMGQSANNTLTVTFWDKNLDETDNLFEFKIDGYSVWSEIPFGAFSGANFHTIPLSVGTSPETFKITGRMRAKHNTGTTATSYSAYSSELSFVFSNEPPTTPRINGFVALSETTALLNWTPSNINEKQYIIERSDLNGPYVRVGDVSGTTLSFNDKDLKHNTVYGYRIKACNEFGCSDYVYGSLTTKNGTPAAPGKSSLGIVSPSKVIVNWTDLSNNESNFILQRAGSDLVYKTVAMPAANTNSFTNIDLKPSTKYFYRIAASNSFATSTYTELGDITTPGGMPSNIGLGILSPNSVAISWTDNTSDEVGFEIYRSDESQQFVKIATVGANVQNFNDNTAKEDTKYFYQIRTLFGSFTSNPITGDIKTPKKQPTDPTNIVATPATFNSINVVWKDNSKDEESFELERAEGKGFVLLVKLPANTVSYTDTSAKENTLYAYRVRAVNPAGKSGYAISEDIKTPFEPVATPTDLIAVANAYNEVKLTWKDNAKNETAYVVEKSTDGITFTAINLPANTSSYKDNTVVDNASYTYRVFAKNTNVSSIKTANVTVKTPLKPLNPPTVLTLKSLSDNEISLTWQDNEGLETGFEIQRSKDGINYTKIAEVKTNVITYLDANLDASTKYYYRVRAFNTTQFSVFSNVAEISTLVTTSVIKEKLTESINVYPNPAQDKINVDYPVGTENVKLISQFGALISTKVVDKTSTSTEINLSGIPAGLYFISAENKSNTITKKIVKN